MAEIAQNLLGMTGPAGFYTRTGNENKARMIRGGVQVTQGALLRHGDADADSSTCIGSAL